MNALIPSSVEEYVPFQFVVCDEKLLSGVSLQVHEQLDHPAKATSTQKHVCPQCLKNFTSSYNMLRHLEKQHEAGTKEDQSQPTKKIIMECIT